MSDDTRDYGVELDLVGLIIQGRYEVTRLVGEGGMGKVYLAHDRQLPRKVVVKVPKVQLLADPEFRARFEREIKSLIGLEHPHVLKVLDVGAVRGVPYAMLQYLGGGNLDHHLQAAGGPLSPQQVLEWLPDISRALDFIHRKGYVHRDIKPGNIMFDENGFPFLGDFGIVRALGDDESALTRTGLTPGSPRYMAPEAALGLKSGPRYDQYSLAVVVYRVLSGKTPHSGDTPLSIVTKKAVEPPMPLAPHVPELPPAAAAVVMKALSREPEGRYESCEAFAKAFAAAVTAPAATRTPAENTGPNDATMTLRADEATGPTPDRPKHWGRRLVAVALLAGAAAAAWIFRDRVPEDLRSRGGELISTLTSGGGGADTPVSRAPDVVADDTADPAADDTADDTAADTADDTAADTADDTAADDTPDPAAVDGPTTERQAVEGVASTAGADRTGPGAIDATGETTEPPGDPTVVRGREAQETDTPLGGQEPEAGTTMTEADETPPPDVGEQPRERTGSSDEAPVDPTMAADTSPPTPTGDHSPAEAIDATTAAAAATAAVAADREADLPPVEQEPESQSEREPDRRPESAAGGRARTAGRTSTRAASQPPDPIASLLAEAKDLRDRLRLTSGGRNATTVYREVLALDPGNTDAVAGLESVRDYFIKRGAELEGAGSQDEALERYRKALTILPSTEADEAITRIEKAIASRTRDDTPPSVGAFEPADGAAVQPGTVEIVGLLRDEDLASVEAERCDCSPEPARFTCRCEVGAGEHVFRFTLRDAAGNESVETLTLEGVRSTMSRPAVVGGLQPLGRNPQGHEAFERLKDGMRVVHVPGGTFRMGHAGGREDEAPVHQVSLSPYLIDEAEVSWAQFMKLQNSLGVYRWTMPKPWKPGPDEPVQYVSWDQAAEYCEWVGARLPTEAEWELAARGTDGRLYPWGDEYEDGKANLEGTRHDIHPYTAPTGTYPGGASPYGAYNMASNVTEWVADWYGPYAAASARDPRGPSSGAQRVHRGGDFTYKTPENLRATRRNHKPPDIRRGGFGFRCAMDRP